MAQLKGIVDDYGIINEAEKILPDNAHKIQFLQALAELENAECHRTRNFPRTRLHRVRGSNKKILRADINKTSGWRINVQYDDDKRVHLKDIISGQRHDDVLDIITSKDYRYK